MMPCVMIWHTQLSSGNMFFRTTRTALLRVVNGSSVKCLDLVWHFPPDYKLDNGTSYMHSYHSCRNTYNTCAIHNTFPNTAADTSFLNVIVAIDCTQVDKPFLRQVPNKPLTVTKSSEIKMTFIFFNLLTCSI